MCRLIQAKLRYDPVELDPEDMCRLANEQPQVCMLAGACGKPFSTCNYCTVTPAEVVVLLVHAASSVVVIILELVFVNEQT